MCWTIPPPILATSSPLDFGPEFAPPLYQSKALDPHPHADGRLNRVGQPNYGAVPPSHLQLQPVQLGRIVTAGGVGVQQLHPPFRADDTLLGDLQLPFYNADRASQGPQFQIIDAARLLNGRHGRDSSNSPGINNRCSVARNKVHRREGNNFYGWRQSMAIDHISKM